MGQLVREHHPPPFRDQLAPHGRVQHDPIAARGPAVANRADGDRGRTALSHPRRGGERRAVRREKHHRAHRGGPERRRHLLSRPFGESGRLIEDAGPADPDQESRATTRGHPRPFPRSGHTADTAHAPCPFTGPRLVDAGRRDVEAAETVRRPGPHPARGCAHPLIPQPLHAERLHRRESRPARRGPSLGIGARVRIAALDQPPPHPIHVAASERVRRRPREDATCAGQAGHHRAAIDRARHPVSAAPARLARLARLVGLIGLVRHIVMVGDGTNHHRVPAGSEALR